MFSHTWHKISHKCVNNPDWLHMWGNYIKITETNWSRHMNYTLDANKASRQELGYSHILQFMCYILKRTVKESCGLEGTETSYYWLLLLYNKYSWPFFNVKTFHTTSEPTITYSDPVSHEKDHALPTVPKTRH